MTREGVGGSPRTPVQQVNVGYAARRMRPCGVERAHRSCDRPDASSRVPTLPIARFPPSLVYAFIPGHLENSA